ncbi:MAG: hypothetical protein M3N95_12645 [Actinomycetota bacterium]|nr:hypothetical protein [Actinomycetota bacterium]
MGIPPGRERIDSVIAFIAVAALVAISIAARARRQIEHSVPVVGSRS